MVLKNLPIFSNPCWQPYGTVIQLDFWEQNPGHNSMYPFFSVGSWLLLPENTLDDGPAFRILFPGFANKGFCQWVYGERLEHEFSYLI